MSNESTGDTKNIYRAFHVKDHASLQDVLHCMLLSECVYKAYEGGPAAVPPALAALQRSFHPSLCALDTVQCSHSHVQHRYIVSSSAEALYVAFMGTKVLRDYLADANYLQATLWPGVQASAGQGTVMAENPRGSAYSAKELAAAHQGFLARSQSVPVELLYIRARQQGKRLVLCGHSLGGAVAKLCTLRLLHQLDSREAAHGHVKCVAFAAPALGNAALATLVLQQGWSHAFYNLTLPEDIVPRLLAVRYAASLPAAAADAVSQPQAAAQEDTAGASMPGPESEDKGGARPSWRSTSATAAGSPSRSSWHTSLSSSMDKLRALTSGTAQSRPAAHPPDVPTQLDNAAPVHGEQHADAEEQGAPQQQNQQMRGLRSYVPSWGPARYLPSFVPFGGQHHLYASATAAAATPLLSSAAQFPEAFDAEDAEALAALESQEDPSPQPQAPAGGQEHQRDSSYPSTNGSREQPALQPASNLSTLPGLPSGAEQVEAERGAGPRRFALPLTYHRMYTMRERAAAICSAVWPPDEGRSEPAVKLSQDLAPSLHVMAARAQLPVLPPSPTQPSALQPAYRRWSPTALWASTSGAFARRLPASLGDSRASEGTEGESGAPAGLLASSHRVLAIGQGALDQLRSSAQQALLPQQPREQEQVRGTSSVAADDPCKAARTTASWWSPWTAAPARPAHTAPQAPSPSKARPWLPSGASRWMSSSPQEDAARLYITISGQGLAGCTSARLQTLDGSFHEACITSAPAVSLPSLTEPQQAAAPQPPGKLRLQVVRQKLMDVGRHTWQRLQSKGAATAQPKPEVAIEELLLEVKLKHADAQAIANSCGQDDGSHSKAGSTLKIYLRSDFAVVRAEVTLSQHQVWVLGSSSHTVDRLLQLLGASVAKHAFLPGVKTAAAGAISYTCLVPANRDLATVAQLASEHIQGSRPMKGHGQTHAKELEAPNGDSSLRPTTHMVTYSQTSHPLYKTIGMLLPAYRAQAIEAARVVSSALTSTVQHVRLSASQTTAAARAQLQRLRHRHTVLAMQQQSTPNMIVLCFPGRSLVIGDRVAQRQPAPAVYRSFLRGQSQTAHSIVEMAAVRSLVDNAHRAGIPALVIMLTEDRDLEIHTAECAKVFQLSDTDRLVFVGGKPSSSEAFNLKRAIFDCLESSKQSSKIPSKL